MCESLAIESVCAGVWDPKGKVDGQRNGTRARILRADRPTPTKSFHDLNGSRRTYKSSAENKYWIDLYGSSR